MDRLAQLDHPDGPSDGTITLRRPVEADSATLIAGRDAEFRRFIGEGAPETDPTAVVLDAAGDVVGWIGYDVGRDWLSDDEVNIGYSTFPEHRGRGFARRALLLLLPLLADQPELNTATLLIDPENAASLALAHSAGFQHVSDVDDQMLFKKPLR